MACTIILAFIGVNPDLIGGGGGAAGGEVRGTPFEQEGLNSLLHFSL